MIWLIKNWRIVLSGVLIVGLSAFTYSKGANSVQRDWDKEKLEVAKEQVIAIKRNRETINRLEAVKNGNIKTIADLRDDLSHVRVRVPASPCVRPNPTSGGTSTTTPTGDISIAPQGAFDRFRQRLESDALEVDTIIESCRVVIGWAKGSEQ